MRRLVFSAAVFAGVAWGGVLPVTPAPLPMSGLNSPNAEATPVEEVGYRRRQYRRYGYPVPYVLYPPVYGYYPPPPAYAYPPVHGYDAPPPEIDDNGDYPAANGDYGDYGDYPPAGAYYGDYPAADGY